MTPPSSLDDGVVEKTSTPHPPTMSTPKTTISKSLLLAKLLRLSARVNSLEHRLRVLEAQAPTLSFPEPNYPGPENVD